MVGANKIKQPANRREDDKITDDRNRGYPQNPMGFWCHLLAWPNACPTAEPAETCDTTKANRERLQQCLWLQKNR